MATDDDDEEGGGEGREYKVGYLSGRQNDSVLLQCGCCFFTGASLDLFEL